MQILAIDKIQEGVTPALVQEGLLDFDLIPIGPLMPLGRLNPPIQAH